MKYDFKGYATKYGVKCADGRTISHSAFAKYDGKTLPLAWEHQHDDPTNVIGNVILEHRDDGLYAYGSFNDTEKGKIAKSLVAHKDITRMSIFANRVVEDNRLLVHSANLIEVSLVYSGANEGALIDTVSFAHGNTSVPYDAVIYSSEDVEYDDDMSHSNTDPSEGGNKPKKTLGDILDTLNDEQRAAFDFAIDKALSMAETIKEGADSGENKNDPKKGDGDMKHNVFSDAAGGATLSHSQLSLKNEEAAIFAEAKTKGSLKETVLAHSVTYGIENVDYLFPEAKLVDDVKFIQRDMDWVNAILSGVKFVPFRRIKSVFADITENEARAKGYIKGKEKVDEVITLLKRETTPTTIYKKQTMDRDDLLDLQEFSAVAMLKKEMTMMINEEFARAILVGDGRTASDNNKINPLNIRPIYDDAELYTVKITVNVTSSMTTEEKMNALIDAMVRARKQYTGSGTPMAFVSPDSLSDMILLKDKNGRRIYNSESELASAGRVSSIFSVPVMSNITHSDSTSNYELAAILFNPKDYAVGRDPRVSEEGFFDDFDLNYNKEIYLTERRRSGALITPHSAIVIEFKTAKPTQG